MRLFLFFLLLTVPAFAKDGVFYLPPQHNFMAQADWDDIPSTVYHTDGAAYTRLNGSEVSAAGTLTLTSTLAAGSYALWIRCTSIASAGNVNFTAGDATVTGATFSNTDSTGGPTWSKISFTSSTTFSTIVFAFMRNGGAGGPTHDYYLNGFYVTPNVNETYVANSLVTGFFDLTPSGSTNNADFVSRNLLPNSSFELGVTHGWMWSRDGSTSVNYLSGAISSSESHSGTKSWLIGNAGGRFILYSPNIRIRNDRVTRNYTLSFWAKSSTGTITLATAINHLLPNASETYSENKSITTSWTRFTKTVAFSSVPTAEITFSLSHISGDSVFIDDIQFEEGSTATTYAPMSAIECALSTSALFHAATTAPTVYLNTYNTGSPVVKTSRVLLYDWMNELVGSVDTGLTCPTGLQAHTISLSGWRSGSHRVVGWIAGDPWRDEIVASIVPTTTATADTTQKIGIMSNVASALAAQNLGYGFTWNRSLSPGVFFRWSAIEPTDDAFTWAATDAKVNSLVAGGQTILATIQEGAAPAFALSGGVPIQAEIQEYITAIVNRYKDRITWWEDWNEVQVVYTAAQYAPVLTWIVDAIKAEDPAAKFVAFGGATAAPSTWADGVWALLSAPTKAKIDAVSCHIYGSSLNDRMIPTPDLRLAPWATFGSTSGKPVWNTESGVWDMGVMKSDIVGVMTSGFAGYDYWMDKHTDRGNWVTIESGIQSVIRSLGYGFARFIYHDARNVDYRIATADTQSSFYEYSDAVKPIGTALMWLQQALSGKTLITRLANPGATTTEGYLFSGGGQSVIICFNYNKLSKLFACVKTGVTQYDPMWNVITPEATGFVVDRVYRYWVSNSLSAGQMETLWEGATVSAHTDVTAPKVSVESSPHMALFDDQTHVFLRWSASDNNDVNSDSAPTVVLSRSRLVGKSDTWSNWGTATYRHETGLSNTTTYQLQVEAKDSANNVGTASGPLFGNTTLLHASRPRFRPR